MWRSLLTESYTANVAILRGHAAQVIALMSSKPYLEDSVMNILLATRKGLFEVHTQAAKAKIVRHDFPGDALSQILVDPRDGTWYAAQNLGHFGVKMKRSTDKGKSWEEISPPAFPTKPTEGFWADDPTPWNVELVWELVAGGNDLPGELWAGCIPAGLFRSTDYGQSWQLIESLWHLEQRRDWFGGGFDQAGIHSILVDPRDPKHLTIAISCAGIWESRDRGQTWQIIGEGQEADYLPPEQTASLNQQDPHRLVQCASSPDVMWIQHHAGQYQSTNSSQTFRRVNKGSGKDFGFAVAVDPLNSQRAWFVPAVSDGQRFAPGGALCVLRTDDGGQTFNELRAGLPQHSCYDLIYRHNLIVDASGKCLAMASSTGHLWFSRDAGEHWHAAEMLLPPVYALSYC
jgi:hypothetical protein